MRLCFASANAHKLSEAKFLLAPLEIIGLRELDCVTDIPENEPTIEGNSATKANFVWSNFRQPCFADDTGLEVEALNGAPGVRSARFAGEPADDKKNVALLLQKLEGVENRNAQFKTVITLQTSEEPKQFTGILRGTITHEPKGKNGFGYDSVFIPEGSEKTLAELSAKQKNKISHRFLALQKMKAFLLDTHRIKDWSPEDRPREKLEYKGASALTDAELLGILINTGNKKYSAVELAKQVLQAADNDLTQLSRLSLSQLTGLYGIGKAKAITIMAAMELSKRRKETKATAKKHINSSRDAFEVMQAELMDLAHEEFWVILLNYGHQVIKCKRIGEGSASITVVDIKKIFRYAFEEKASKIVLVHNHPSGNMNVSKSDIDLTNRIKEVARFHDIQLLDHVIIGNGEHYSFADAGRL